MTYPIYISHSDVPEIHLVFLFIQVELVRRMMMDWHAKIREQIYGSRLLEYAENRGTVALNCINTMQSIILAQARTVWGLVTVRAKKIHGILLSTSAGPLLIACLGVTNEVWKKGKEMTRNCVDMVNVMLRGSKAMMEVGVLIADGMLRSSVKEVKNWSARTVERVVKNGYIVISVGVNVTKKALSDTTQVSLSTLALLSSTIQTKGIAVVKMGRSVSEQGIDMMRNILCVNGRILLRILITNQMYIPGCQHFLNLVSLFGVPFIEVPAAVHHDAKQKHPESTAIHQGKELQPSETAASRQNTKLWNPETGAEKATPTRHLQNTSLPSEVGSNSFFF